MIDPPRSAVATAGRRGLGRTRSPPLAEKDPHVVQELNRWLPRGSGALCFIAPYQPEQFSPSKVQFASIGFADELEVEDAIEALTTAGVSKLCLLVNSLGGGVSSSFKIARAIRDSFRDITVFVPHIAASGGTLLALTGNRIVMGPLSHLSPIDVQLERNGIQVSVNAMVRSLSALNELFSKTAEDDAPFPLKAMANKLDPVEFQEWVDAANLMQAHAEAILASNPSFRDRAPGIVEHLTEHLPTHDYSITFAEAGQILGSEFVLSPWDPRVRDQWPVMKRWFRHYVRSGSGVHIVKYHVPDGRNRGRGSSGRTKKGGRGSGR